jgi:hypothetical protein
MEVTAEGGGGGGVICYSYLSDSVQCSVERESGEREGKIFFL